jgi:chaperonin GroEL
VVIEDLRRQSRQVRGKDDITRVATLSANDDPGLGALIAEAMERVGRQGVISVGEAKGLETTLEVVEGLRFERGYFSPYFVTNPDTMDVVLENALVLLTELKLATARELLRVLELAADAKRPLLVVADDVEGEALATLVLNRLRGTVTSVAVRAPESGDRRRDFMEDLATLTGARVVTRELGQSLEKFAATDFGRVKRVLVTRDSTTLAEGGGRPDAIRQATARLERAMRDSDSEYDKGWMRQRIARLTGGIAVIRVGAATELEMNERRVRAEDALAATKSAVEEGLVAGGGVALLRAQPKLDAIRIKGDERVGVDIVRHALEEPARQIAANAGEEGAVVVEKIRAGQGWFGFNALTLEYGDLEQFGILDPVKVTRCALQHAASIGTLLLTTDAIVVDVPEEEGEEGRGEGDDDAS